ncbi:protein DELETION OF SUV3 SUPPRESSOR 1(I)-like [Phalaenopsis equestris]|uniref:protein DELETION OF SUV3 SUPPRESSOR 1(I)-like n=1 Tax=Phalaenopsis equestris TaxID=78828 RepID=UPI0009E3C79A|nr:protein DELETION OF SUV3 SUPPRESSOR 1(I)-like [Phalaenopsis equestris]
MHLDANIDKYEMMDSDTSDNSREPEANEDYSVRDERDDKEEGKEVLQQWEDDWDDDDVNDDFSLQLRKELRSNSEKK